MADPLKIAIIPARGGSKRIPKKNMREFCGTPAIRRTIMKLRHSDIFNEIVVSTDDLAIARVAEESGADRVLMRESGLADDITPTVPVIAQAIEELCSSNNDYKSENLAICCVYPVNPFLDINDLVSGYGILNDNESIDYVNPVCKYSYPTQRALRLGDSNFIEMCNPELVRTRSQDLEDLYHDAGQWYWGKAESWLSKKDMLVNSIGLEVSRWKCQDIDTLEDWEYAEMLFKIATMRSEYFEADK